MRPRPIKAHWNSVHIPARDFAHRHHVERKPQGIRVPSISLLQRRHYFRRLPAFPMVAASRA